MSEEQDELRRVLRDEINKEGLKTRAEVEARHGPCWDTEELKRDFEVIEFLARFVAVGRRSDGASGSLLFQHWPRFYFCWQQEGETVSDYDVVTDEGRETEDEGYLLSKTELKVIVEYLLTQEEKSDGGLPLKVQAVAERLLEAIK